MTPNEPLWTIAELGELVARALSVDYEGQLNGQVRDVPDRRTIRYYTTLGLIDRPARMRGRTALYGRRHLLQLVAIKRLQAKGQSLVEIQEQLLNLPAAALNRLARLPAGLETLPSSPPTSTQTEEPAPERPPGPFWSASPAPVGANPLQAPGPPLQTLQSVRLAEDAALLLTSAQPLTAEIVEAIQAAAEPLLQLLESRRLLHPRQQRGIE
jgi:DNA-binding transcriptional MerR regulator